MLRIRRKPLGRLRSFAFAACEPERMGLGPAYAIPIALRRAGVKEGDSVRFGGIELRWEE